MSTETSKERRARLNRQRPLISFSPPTRVRIERVAGRAGFTWKEQVRAWVRLALERAEAPTHEQRLRSLVAPPGERGLGAPMFTAPPELPPAMAAETVAALRDSGVREEGAHPDSGPDEALAAGVADFGSRDYGRQADATSPDDEGPFDDE